MDSVEVQIGGRILQLLNEGIAAERQAAQADFEVTVWIACWIGDAQVKASAALQLELGACLHGWGVNRSRQASSFRCMRSSGNPVFGLRTRRGPGESKRPVRIRLVAQESLSSPGRDAHDVDRCPGNREPSWSVYAEVQLGFRAFQIDLSLQLGVSPNQRGMDGPGTASFLAWAQTPGASGRRIGEFEPAFLIRSQSLGTAMFKCCVDIEIRERGPSAPFDDLDFAPRRGFMSILKRKRGWRSWLGLAALFLSGKIFDRSCNCCSTSLLRMFRCPIEFSWGCRPDQPRECSHKQANTQAEAKAEGAGVGQGQRLDIDRGSATTENRGPFRRRPGERKLWSSRQVECEAVYIITG